MAEGPIAEHAAVMEITARVLANKFGPRSRIMEKLSPNGRSF
jgi:hypothetical protein